MAMQDTGLGVDAPGVAPAAGGLAAAPPAPKPAAFAHPSEAQFARLLDFYGVDWQYEPRSFPLRREGERVVEAFTPDFYLPAFDLYVELTTLRQSLVTYKNRKLRLLREQYPEINIKLLYRRDYLRLLERFGIDPRHSSVLPPVAKVLVSQAELQRRVAELGAAISRDFAGSRPVLIGVLRGVVCFMADLMRVIELPITVDFLALSSYDEQHDRLRFTKDLDEEIRGQRVIVVEDVVDTGISLHRLLQYLQEREPAEISVCALLDKRARRLANVALSYVGFEIGDEFAVGYGLDYRQEFRNLPYIGVVRSEGLG
ncbi:MAG TPA: hypoxanthine phosphoribosyltransferase [Dehalococcoidia bacterium]|nr:hypoxanthine phosphoribosyltransferase [Dehalococcoidia bacterium]